MDRYDSIIIGAGHNGLVCAAYLAQKGQRVLVLEAAAAAGGLGAAREFHPGFRTAIAHSVSHFSQAIADDLKLASFGYGGAAVSVPTVGLDLNGNHIVVAGNELSGAGANDVTAYERYCESMHRFADVLKPFWLKTMPRIGSANFTDLTTFGQIGLNLRRLGKQDMQEFLRIASLPARDLMDENFENEVVKATLSWDGLLGAKMAPRSPNSAILAILYRMSSDSRGAHCVAAGGVSELINSLHGAVQAAGVTLKNDAAVARIVVSESGDGLRATGVELRDGGRIEAEHVISSADPKTTFLDLLGVQYLDIGFTNRIRRLRCDGYVAKLHLALNDLPEFDGLQQTDGRLIIAPDMDAIEFAFDDAKYGDCSKSPVMEVVLPSLHDPSVAPDGKHVLSAHVMYVPKQLRGGWTDAAREQICQQAIDTIAHYAPQIREQIVGQQFLTPADIEQQYRVTGGHWHHTEFALDQMLMMRPTYGAAQYQTPVPGLYLCGAGCHPGGDLVGAAGHNAAQVILG